MNYRYWTFLFIFTFSLILPTKGEQNVAASSIPVIQSITVKSLPDQQVPFRPGSDIRFSRYTADQGLSMSVVNSIAQDREGFLWFATQDGLNRFDGREFKIIKRDPDNPNSISANWVNVLLVDSIGTLWIGTNGGGLDRYTPADGKLRNFIHDPANPESIVDNYITSYMKTGLAYCG